MILLRDCKSAMCPETADRSFWNVDMNASNEASKVVLDYLQITSALAPFQGSALANLDLIVQLSVIFRACCDCRTDRFSQRA